jgi:hypothetical protein
MNIKHALIGADPELFVSNHGVVSSAIGLVGGTKEEPRPVPHGALQEDNVLLEFNIDPASNLDEFRFNIREVMKSAADTLAQFQRELILDMSSHSYLPSELRGFGKSAFVFGCDPDFNAWTGEPNPRPECDDPGLRTAGGHLHIGYSHLEEVDGRKNRDIIQMCDYILGLPSILLDKDDRRRALYGKGGAMRHKPYGTEYRTLSNFWLASDELLAWAYEGAVNAYAQMGKLDMYCDLISGQEVQRIINENDKVSARMALQTLEIKYA